MISTGLQFSGPATLCRHFRWNRSREDLDPRVIRAKGYLPTESAGFWPRLHKKRTARADFSQADTSTSPTHICGVVCRGTHKQSTFESIQTSKESDQKDENQSLVDQSLGILTFKTIIPIKYFSKCVPTRSQYTHVMSINVPTVVLPSRVFFETFTQPFHEFYIQFIKNLKTGLDTCHWWNFRTDIFKVEKEGHSPLKNQRQLRIM